MRCRLYYKDKETQVPCIENYTIKAISHVYTTWYRKVQLDSLFCCIATKSDYIIVSHHFIFVSIFNVSKFSFLSVWTFVSIYVCCTVALFLDVLVALITNHRCVIMFSLAFLAHCSIFAILWVTILFWFCFWFPIVIRACTKIKKWFWSCILIEIAWLKLIAIESL